MSRLPPLLPDSLDSQQKALYDELSATAERAFGDKSGLQKVSGRSITDIICRFITKTKEGILVGPFGIYLNTPALAGALRETVAGLSQMTGVSARHKEVAILTVGAHFQAAYELYAHTNVSLSSTDLSSQEIDQIKIGEKPASFKKDDSAAYDVARALVTRPGPLPSTIYQEAETIFGAKGIKTLIHVIAFYTSISVLLNAFDVQVPEAET